MPWRPEGGPTRPRLLIASVAILLAIGFALTLAIFYPGVMTFDSKYLHEYAMKGTMGDWQSPVMVWLWGLIDPIAPGAGSMFLLIAATYWLGFATAFAHACIPRQEGRAAAAVAGIDAAVPGACRSDLARRPLRSVLAARGVDCVRGRRAAIMDQVRGAGTGACTGRFRRTAAAERLAGGADTRRLRGLAVAAHRPRGRDPLHSRVLVFFGCVQLVYYGILDAKREHPLQTIMIFDLGGISHFARANQFPVEWSEAENAMLLDTCYQPTMWDIYWRLEPCDFVMRKIEREKGLFGTSAISKAWLAAILHHPVAYLQHRSAFLWNFLAGDNLTMWTADIENPMKEVFPDRPRSTRCDRPTMRSSRRHCFVPASGCWPASPCAASVEQAPEKQPLYSVLAGPQRSTS